MNNFKVIFVTLTTVCALGETLKFWQLTDIHYDQFYVKNGDTKNYCHAAKKGSAGEFGDYSCEANELLLISAIEAMQRFEPEPDFILWTGDSSPHWKNPDSPDWTYIYQAEAHIVKLIRKYFPETLILPTLGNHDAYKPDNFTINDFAYKGDISKYQTLQYIEFLQNSTWNELIENEEAQIDFGFCGFYCQKIPNSDIILISLNTNLYYRSPVTILDPCSQFLWLQEKLEEARRNGQKVILGAHVPPGYFERHNFGPFFTNKGGSESNDYFVNIVNNFSDVILAQIFGHTHTDTFRVFLKDSEAKNVAFIAPSITPLVGWGTGTNPGIRLFHYQQNQTFLSNYHQFYANLLQANLAKEIKWEKLYDFQDLYNVSDLSPSNVLKVYEEMWTQEDLYDRIYQLNTLLKFNDKCEDACEHSFKCAMGNVLIADMEKCLSNRDEKTHLPSLISFSCFVLSMIIVLSFWISIRRLIYSDKRTYSSI